MNALTHAQRAFRALQALCGLLAACACATPLAAPAATASPSAAPLQLAQARQCERRSGPYASQDTAWQQWRQARARGVAVSNGVVPCRDQYGTRGYCFFTFHAC